MNIAEKQAMEERDPNLQWEEDYMISNDREEHCKKVEDKDNKYRGKCH